MKKSISGLLGVIVLLSCLIYVPAASAEGVPNVFSPGTTAKSSEVNQNFNFVNYGNIVVKANGVEVGSLLSFGVNDGITILTPTGYLVSYYPFTHGVLMEGPLGLAVSGIYFSTVDCTGTPYVMAHWVSMVGEVFSYGSSQNLYYTSRNASIVPSVTFQSQLNGTCTSVSPFTSDAYIATPNDPSVTGVSSYALTPPITIERR